LIFVLILYVLATTYPDEPFAELIPMAMLQQALVLSGIVIAVGIVLRILGKGAAAVGPKNRCRVCRRQIVTGAIYCREHLRSILAEEDDRTHATKIRR
jgi:predicted nucleic acid-binding Zn ribbon protein